MPLTGKVALVTGASRGIGHAIAIDLARQGATVIGTATTQEGADKISAIFTDQSLKGQGLVLNVTDANSIEAALNSIQSNHYEPPTILINNAGITRDNLMLRMKEEEWGSVLDTNLTAIYRVSKACLRGMLKARWGRIVNISSVVGSTGNAGQANYAAAKAGLIGFSKSLAQEIASRDITVNVVAPGYIETDMTQQLTEAQKNAILAKIPAQRIGKPEDIAYAVKFLVSPQAAYITGQTLHVNGGMYMN
jgi:3-oxoacyl-[acyl-carrier protein] reductase